MVLASLTLKNDYWETIHLQDDDIEAIYHHLLEIETPLTVKELVGVLVDEVSADERDDDGVGPIAAPFIKGTLDGAEEKPPVQRDEQAAQAKYPAPGPIGHGRLLGVVAG